MQMVYFSEVCRHENLGLKLNLGMDRPDNGVAVTTSVKKSGLNYLSRWVFSLKFEDTKTLGLKLNLGMDRPDNGVAVTTSVQKVGLII